MAAYQKLFNVVGNRSSNSFGFSSTGNSILLGQQCAMLKSRVLEKKLGIPPKPKRPMSPFIMYSVQERQKVLQENPGLKPQAVMKKMAELWKTYSSLHKQAMHKLYVQNLEDYTKKIMAYEQNLTDEQKKAIKTEKFRMIAATEKTKIKSRLRELGKPKKPPTTFILYMLSRVNTKSKDVKFPEWLGVAAKEWNEAPEELKAKFEGETKKLMEEYKKEMINWEEKMIKLGHIDVVRKQVLMDLKGKSITPDKS